MLNHGLMRYMEQNRELKMSFFMVWSTVEVSFLNQLVGTKYIYPKHATLRIASYKYIVKTNWDVIETSWVVLSVVSQ